jgi:hypothetical protein
LANRLALFVFRRGEEKVLRVMADAEKLKGISGTAHRHAPRRQVIDASRHVVSDRAAAARIDRC